MNFELFGLWFFAIGALLAAIVTGLAPAAPIRGFAAFALACALSGLAVHLFVIGIGQPHVLYRWKLRARNLVGRALEGMGRTLAKLQGTIPSAGGAQSA